MLCADMVNQIDSDTTKHTIGANIERLRRRSEKTATAICEELGMNRSYYYSIEAGTANVTIDVLEAIARFFEVPVSMLFTERRRKSA